LRIERNNQAFVSGLQNSSINNAQQRTTSIQSGSSSQGNSVANSSPISSNISGKAANQPERTAARDRTCAIEDISCI
jgi:hypothetical protein